MPLLRSFVIAVGSLTFAAVVSLPAPQADQTHNHKITAAQAQTAVLRKYKSGKIQGKTALENEDGKWQYAVMVKVNGKLHEVMVNANNGKIESEEIVTAKEEAAEKKAEEAARKHGKKPGVTSAENNRTKVR